MKHERRAFSQQRPDAHVKRSNGHAQICCGFPTGEPGRLNGVRLGGVINRRGRASIGICSQMRRKELKSEQLCLGSRFWEPPAGRHSDEIVRPYIGVALFELPAP